MIWKPITGRYGGIYWFVLQTYSAAEIAFDRFDRLLFQSPLLRRKPNSSDLCFFLQNGANIFFKSGDKPQNLRAETLDGAIIDECRQQQPPIWNQIIMPMLGRYNGWCDFYSTPNGYDWFYDLHEKARVENPLGQWAVFNAPSTEAFWWTDDQIAQAKANMSEAEFSQEILAEFRDLTAGTAYFNHGAHNQRKTSPFSTKGELLSPYLPLLLAFDFNVNPGVALIGQERNSDFYWAQEVWIKNSNTQEIATELIDRIKMLTPNGHKPGARVIGDATGKANKTSASGETDYSIIMRALDETFGRSWATNITPESNPPVKDRVNVMNGRLKSADGSIHFWYHPTNCAHLKKDLERVVWKEGAGAILDQKRDPMLTHISDAAGYAVHLLTQQLWSESPGVLRILNR